MGARLLILVGVLVTLSFTGICEVVIPSGFGSAVLQPNQTFTVTTQPVSSRALNYSSGYYDGYYDGFKDGYRSGYKDGYATGYNYTGAFKDGYKNGYVDGYTDGFNGRQPDLAKANLEIKQLHMLVGGLSVLLAVFIVLSIALYTHRRIAQGKNSRTHPSSDA